MLVQTPTTVKNIENIQTALETSNAVLIQGEIGSGKSLTVDYLASLLGFKDTLIQVDVDDSFDSKDLLGKFSATETPGSFEWLPGPLTLAVENGYWILMEDIDLASFDVFSVLLSLLENSTLFLSDKNKVISAHPNFKLIATQQIVVSGDALFSKKNSIPYQELWGSVIMSRIPSSERCDIVYQLYDKVPLSVLESLTSLSDGCVNPNVINLRTLLRWGRRVNRRLEMHQNARAFLSSTVREMLLREAYDCFVARFAPGTEQSSVLALICDACGVPINVAETLVVEHKPQQSIQPNGCTFGRVFLLCNTITRISRQSRIAFAETRQAMSLLERLAAAVESKEHVLLTGETGVGKTFVVQYLADQLGQNLIVHNLNQQTDTSDFMGGWKPLDLGVSMRELYNDFTELFGKCFNVEKNANFLNAIQTAFSSRNWERTARLFQKGCASFCQKLVQQETLNSFAPLWKELGDKVEEALNTILQTNSSMAFFYEEGSLVKAWREGHWILLDELNLATTEVLERVSTILGDVDRIFLTDKGSSEAVMRHKNFHVFANMNPPTDVGKKDLPPSLRSRFTECYVNEPFNISDINAIVREYIGFLTPDAKINEITDFFLDCVANAKSKLCALDGESKPPSFSMRTLTRALSYVRKATPFYGFNVSLFDGLLLGFATPLQREFHTVVQSLIVKNIFKGRQPSTPKLPAAPGEGNFIPYQHIWIKAGPQEPFNDEGFILTDSVKGHLTNLARAVFAQRPVLLEGPTSSGKSSMVKYLAELTGNTFVRINNHESTEVQEYLGHYVTDEFGKLRFVDGILVNAVRKGSWVVLDELNLAPTDVLEALNRLLDDNCELFIPDTQETIQPHPDLRIFATQNPAGIYGGRKMLSRAFRNRFLEITVDEIPTSEIITILRLRYAMPEGFAVKIVEVMTNLQQRRQSSQIFAGRHGFITPRDLFRWAERKPSTYQELAEHGFLLLGERCRKPAERQIVKDVLESVTKTEICEKELYSPSHWSFVQKYYDMIEKGSIDEFKIVWTESMQRLFTIVGVCLEHCEPVLLVGETGSSKTTVCQLWAALLQVPLRILNCHQHTEAADFLGSLRPVPPDRNDSALFEWRDGVLVECMRHGDFFLLDEVSLTEDSVLERLNSVLEPSRSITLAEKSNGETFTAHERFRVLATMNPGGDFGKKELSPALRNRFTEIYVRPTTETLEVATILSKRLLPELEGWALRMAHVLCGISTSTGCGSIPTHISIRDIISWVEFMNAVHQRCSDDVAFSHGLDALLLDGIGVGSGQLEGTSELLRQTCLQQAEKALGRKIVLHDQKPIWEVLEGMTEPRLPPHLQSRFFFGAPTTQRNLSKLMRSMVLHKAVLLEGSPGVGKTSIVEALGAALSIKVVRINLSEQTDIMDLFGTFLPIPSTDSEDKGPQFAWSDGVLLQALKKGCWAILDELNLASQSVLEGLNALLDHRSAVFIPELNEEFHAHPNFRVFACQNPLAEGGGRKGLPRSFLNRFVKVRVEAFSREDLVVITQAVCSEIQTEVLSAMVDFVADLQQETMVRRTFGLRGSPWEFNLRDVLRWAGLMSRYKECDHPMAFADVLFVQRFRTDEDRAQCWRLLAKHFPDAGEDCGASPDFLLVQNSVVYRGRRLIERCTDTDTGHLTDDAAEEQEEAASTLFSSSHHNKPLLALPSQADTVAALLMCAAHQQFAMLIGTSGSGKTFALRTAAALAGATLVTFSINASCDTIDLLGGFDQVEGKKGQFEWRDSLILEAMLQGYWLALDNVNYCNASVLDRLNPLVEPNGVLSINEQGLVNGETRVVRPHPNFRLFAMMNPRFGEISRAMRNRAVEICLSPVPIPSAECQVLCSSSSRLGNPPEHDAAPMDDTAAEKLLGHLASFHRQFLHEAFRADTTCTLSPSFSDAIFAGSPNIFTILRASSMLVSSDVKAFQKAVLHCYLENRVGSWLHHKAALVSLLQLHVKELESGEMEGVHPDTPRLVDAIRAFTLGNSSLLKRSADFLARRLLRNRVARCAMPLKKAVHSQVEYLLDDLLLVFVLEQATDGVGLEEMTEARVQLIQEGILSDEKAAEVTPLLKTSYCSLSRLPVLYCHAMNAIGPHAAAVSAMRRSAFPLSDSPAVNSAAGRLMALMTQCCDRITEPDVLQRFHRIADSLVHGVTQSEGGLLSPHNFVPLVTRTLLLLELAEEHPHSFQALQEPVLTFLEAMRRHLNLPYSLAGGASLLQPMAPVVHITSVEEREVLQAYHQLQSVEGKAAATSAADALRPLWRTAAFRFEFALLQGLIRLVELPLTDLVPRTSGVEAIELTTLAGASQLVNLIQSFLLQFTETMPLFTLLDLSLWSSVRDALLPATRSGVTVNARTTQEDVRRYVPLLLSNTFQRFGLRDILSLFFGSWSTAAYRCVRFASDVPVISIGSTDSQHMKLLDGLGTFLSSCRLAQTDPLYMWRRNMKQELLQMISCCLPSARELCLEAGQEPSLIGGALLSVIEDGLRRPTSTEMRLSSNEQALLELLVGVLRSEDVSDPAKRAGSGSSLPLRAVALLCALKCRLLLPSSPIDPMYKRSLHADIARAEKCTLERLHATSSWAAQLSQRPSLPFPHMRILEQLRGKEEEHLETALRDWKARPDPTGRQYAVLTSELHRMANTFLSNERLQHVTARDTPEESVDTWGELLFQETLSLLSAYGGYEDATLNIAQASLFAALTSQVLVKERSPAFSPSAVADSLLDSATTLRQLQFPCGLGRSVVVPEAGTYHLTRRLHYLDACLTFLRGSVAQTLDPELPSAVFEAYRALYRHVEEQNERDRLAEELAVKYKERSLLIEGDDEKMLQKLRDLFPSYEKEFVLSEEGEDNEKDEEAKEEKEANRIGHQSRILFSERDGAFVRRMAETYTEFYHRLLKGGLQKTDFNITQQLQSFQSRFDVLASELMDLQKRHGSLAVGDFDEAEECLLLNGFAARAGLLRQEFSAAGTTVEEKNTSGFNIFRDPEPSELRRFSVPLGRLQHRLRELLEVYPENVTLLLCLRVATKISQLSALKTPLMKVMTGCEVLLRQCYEWERNAAQAVSLMAQMTELSSFVLRWRRLELHCWGHVFKAKQEEYELLAALRWFELYDVSHAEEDDAMDEVAHCMQLFQRLTQYLWSSTLGDFAARLRVARGVAFELACRSGLTAPRSNVALHVVDFFSQFEEFVSEKCTAAVRPLEEDMEEFCRVMRWEDANFYAVRATVEKSHLKVARVLAGLEDALRPPILPLLVAEEERCEADPAMGFPSPPDPEAVAESKRRKKTPKKAANETERLGKKRRRDGKAVAVPEQLRTPSAAAVLWEPFTQGIEFFTNGANEIIFNVSSLQAPKTPQQMKIRALKMLFERLAASGISCTHEQQVEHWEILYASTEALLGCRTAYLHQGGAEPLQEAAQKHYQLCRWVQKMREAERHPHQDLSMAQVKRGTGTVETLFAHVVTLTRWAFQLFQLYEELVVLEDCVTPLTNSAAVHTEAEVLELEDADVVGASLLLQCLQMVAILRGTTESFQWMYQERLNDPGAVLREDVTTEDRSLLSELHVETERLWNVCVEGDGLRRTADFIPARLARSLVRQLQRLEGVCGRLQRHNDAVVRAAAALCEQRLALVRQGFLRDVEWPCDESGRPTGPQRQRPRLEPPSDTAATPPCALLPSLNRLCDSLDIPLAPASPSNPVAAPLPSGTPPDGEDTATADPSDELVVSEDGVYARYITQLELLRQTTETELHAVQHEREALHEQTMDHCATRSWLHGLTTSEAVELRRVLQRTRSVVGEAKSGAVVALQAQAHFCVVLTRLVTVLMKNGFCKSEEQEEQDGDGDGEGGVQDGTGMDDGQGEKDVTNEMENEDQLMNMKDKEEQKDEDKGKDGEDEEDHAADVETDFKGDKESRDESEDEEGEGEESDQEMGEVNEEDEVQERKKSKRDEQDQDSLNEDDGDPADEVPQDEFEDNDPNEEETGGFENKEEEIRDAEDDQSSSDEKQRELLADSEMKSLEDEERDTDSDSADGGSREDQEEEVTDKDMPTDQDEEADDEREGSEDRQKDETDSNEDRSSREGEEEAEALSGEDVDAEAEAEDAPDAPDENVFEGGQQDDRVGEEATENKDEKPSQQQQPDAAGADEQQPGDEQEQDDAGRNWQRQQEQNNESQRKDNSEQNRSEQSNPYKAMKEALQRHQHQPPQQLNLSKQVEVPKDQPKDHESRQKEKQEEDDVEDFEFDEEGEQEGMAAADELVPPTVAEEEAPSDSDADATDNDTGDEEPQDTRRKRKTPHEELSELKQEDEEEGAEGRKKSKKGGKPVSKPLKDSENDEEEDDVEKMELEEAESEKLARGRQRWQEHEAAVQGLAQQLCEQLRLILAPTLADKLQGDYKTGKRLNMKRIIPYIASQFKKDRIWLRRTKPNKRTYQILVALDDSLSMQCNEAGEFSCRAVTLMAKALQQLEVGEMGVVCFGEHTNFLHHLDDPFTAECGPRIFSEVSFAQTSTKLGRFLETTLQYLDDARERLHGQSRSTTQELQQLLYVFSDGQITENRAELRKLMVRAEEHHQMVVFVILDLKATIPALEDKDAIPASPAASKGPAKPLTSKDVQGLSAAERLRRLKADRESRLNRVQSRSVLDMQLVEFKGGNVVRKSYMEDFPFPYYLIVRELDRLPEIIADSMRQWFELLNGH